MKVRWKLQRNRPAIEAISLFLKNQVNIDHYPFYSDYIEGKKSIFREVFA